jgi:hypothetical protein
MYNPRELHRTKMCAAYKMIIGRATEPLRMEIKRLLGHGLPNKLRLIARKGRPSKRDLLPSPLNGDNRRPEITRRALRSF